MFAQQTSQIRGFDFLSVARVEWARVQGEEKALPVRARFQNFFFFFSLRSSNLSARQGYRVRRKRERGHARG